jgi:type IX secretion system PorP/SprF family membrane protein
MKKTIVIMVVLTLLLVEGVRGQQLPIYGQYLFNNTVVNPAQAGASNSNQFGLLGRHQWINLDGAPKTYSAFLNLALPSNLGVALGIYQDNIGGFKELTIQADIAYHLRVSETWRFAVGLRALGSNQDFSLLNPTLITPLDPNFVPYSTKFNLNVGAGFLLYSSASFVGFSAPKIFHQGHEIVGTELNVSETHLFAYAGHTFKFTEELNFTPSTLFKYSDKAPLQVDFNAIFGLSKFLDFGPVVRTDFANGLDAIGALLGIRLTQNWYLGYKYSYPMNDLNLVTKQTHEVGLRFNWGGQTGRIASPRFFL